MSEILKAAKELRQQSQQEVRLIHENELSVLRQHGENLKAQLKSSDATLSSAIREHEAEIVSILKESQSSLKALQRKALIESGSVILVLMLTLIGLLWWLIGEVKDKYSELEEYRAQASLLTAFGVKLDKNEKGTFIVLPEGTTTDGRPWTVGDRQAIRVVKD